MHRRPPFLITVLFAFVFTACGTAPETVQPTALPVLAPTPVPTPVPLDKIDLVSMLSSSGPLPKGITGGKAATGVPEGYKDAVGKEAINTAVLPVLHNTEAAGDVVVAIYPDEIKLNDAYENRKIMMNMVSQAGGDTADSAGIGKQSILFTASTGLPGTFMVFTRCRAMVNIYMTGDLVDNKTVAAYAKDLDAKLTEAVCR